MDKNNQNNSIKKESDFISHSETNINNNIDRFKEKGVSFVNKYPKQIFLTFIVLMSLSIIYSGYMIYTHEDKDVKLLISPNKSEYKFGENIDAKYGIETDESNSVGMDAPNLYNNVDLFNPNTYTKPIEMYNQLSQLEQLNERVLYLREKRNNGMLSKADSLEILSIYKTIKAITNE